MHIGVLGPIAGEDLAPLLARAAAAVPQHEVAATPQHEGAAMPRGQHGAPLLATLVQELLARGHRVSAVTLSGDLHDANVVIDSGRLRATFCPLRRHAWRNNGLRPGRSIDGWRSERQAMQRALHAEPPDVLHAHWAYEYAWAALDSGLPCVVTCHDAPDEIARLQTRWHLRAYRWRQATFARRVLARAGVVSAVSPYLVQQVQPRARVPVALVPNAVSPLALAQPRRAEAGRARLLVVANGFDARKNSATAMRAAALVAAQRPGVELVLLGAGHEVGGEAERWWRRQAAAGVLAPRFVGACAHQEVLGWMAASDVLVHTAIEESFGLAVAEAMACGLPVLAGRDSGAVPWVTGGHARLVDVRDAGVVAAALLELLHEPAAAAAMAARARGEAQRRFTPALVVDGYEALYRQALQQQAQGAAVQPGAAC